MPFVTPHWTDDVVLRAFVQTVYARIQDLDDPSLLTLWDELSATSISDVDLARAFLGMTHAMFRIAPRGSRGLIYGVIDPVPDGSPPFMLPERVLPLVWGRRVRLDVDLSARGAKLHLPAHEENQHPEHCLCGAPAFSGLETPHGVYLTPRVGNFQTFARCPGCVRRVDRDWKWGRDYVE